MPSGYEHVESSLNLERRELQNQIIENRMRELNSSQSETYSEPCQTSRMRNFGKIVNGLKSVTVFSKIIILDLWQGSGYTSTSGDSRNIR